VIAAPISTTNITGFLNCTRGSSFKKESLMARRSSEISVSDCDFGFIEVISRA